MDERLKAAMLRAIERNQKVGLDYGDRKYLPVKDRLTIFREEFGLEYGIRTGVYVQDKNVIASAEIVDGKGMIIASGNAMVDIERMDAPVESCETFAIGRALACFGLHGGEYASSQEMERVKEKVASPLDKKTVVAHGSNDGLSPDARGFKKEVEDAFPSVGAPSFYIPEDGSRESMEAVYDQIDRIETNEDLGAYFTMLQHEMAWMDPEDVEEIKATLRSRRDQLKGKK